MQFELTLLNLEYELLHRHQINRYIGSHLPGQVGGVLPEENGKQCNSDAE